LKLAAPEGPGSGCQPHGLVEQQTVQTVHDRILGEFQIPGFPLRFSSFPNRLDLEAPFLGEHNQRILSSYLGYSSHRIARLEQKRCAPIPAASYSR